MPGRAEATEPGFGFANEKAQSRRELDRFEAGLRRHSRPAVAMMVMARDRVGRTPIALARCIVMIGLGLHRQLAQQPMLVRDLDPRQMPEMILHARLRRTSERQRQHHAKHDGKPMQAEGRRVSHGLAD